MKNAQYKKCFDKLGDYESTGETPDSIEKLKRKNKELQDMFANFSRNLYDSLIMKESNWCPCCIFSEDCSSKMKYDAYKESSNKYFPPSCYQEDLTIKPVNLKKNSILWGI